MAQRQQQQFKIRSQPLARSSAGAGDHAHHLFRDQGEKVANRGTVLLLPKPDESLAFELAAEERTDARPGQTKRGGRIGIPAEQESVPERFADCAGVDVGAFGCHARATPIAPMSE